MASASPAGLNDTDQTGPDPPFNTATGSADETNASPDDPPRLKNTAPANSPMLRNAALIPAAIQRLRIICLRCSISQTCGISSDEVFIKAH